MNIRQERHLLPRPGGDRMVSGPVTTVVVGGGIAGVAAASVLAERGVRVTILEREEFLGGRAGAWQDRLEDGTAFGMERGFHAFFRQYYNLRALLRRIDPDLSFLRPLDDYPILGPDGAAQSFAGLPRSTPANLAALVMRSKVIGMGDLVRVDRRRALQMLRFDMEETYARHDGTTAAEYLDSLRFPPAARRLFFDVFAHSFFNPEGDMSAAELLMMFHFYFTGNPEGLLFDVCDTPFSSAIWTPFADYLRSIGTDVRLGAAVDGLERTGAARWLVRTNGESLTTDAVVLALPVSPLKSMVERSPDLADGVWRDSIARLEVTAPFVVWRLWLDRPVRAERAPFVGTTGMGALDNISLYHCFEDESRAWQERTGGAVVELHAYAVDPDRAHGELRDDLLTGLHTLYPETREARVLDERYLHRQDCPAFRCGAHALRPGVRTPFEGLALAGDLVRLPFPSALMERAASSGILAANEILARWSIQPEPLRSVPTRGMLASLVSRN